MLYYYGKGSYQEERDKLWQRLVPKLGQAATVQGELLRAVTKLEDGCIRNDNMNWDAGFLQLASYLIQHLCDEKTFDYATQEQIKDDILEICDYGTGDQFPDYIQDEEDVFDRVTDRVIEWCHAHPKLIEHRNNHNLKR